MSESDSASPPYEHYRVLGILSVCLVLFQILGMAFYLLSGVSTFCRHIHQWMAFESSAECALFTVTVGLLIIISTVVGAHRTAATILLITIATMVYWDAIYFAMGVIYSEISCTCCNY